MDISFNKKFYTLNAVKSAARAYKRLADFRIDDKKGFILVNLSDVDKDVKDIIQDEFCNYVLAEVKNKN